MRAVLIPAIMALAAAAGGEAMAQAGGAEAVCAAMATDAERNACLRGVEAARAGSLAPQSAAPALREEPRGFLGLGVFGGGGGAVADERPGAQTLTPAAGQDRAGDRVRANIVSFREPVPGIFEFELDNGQVWRQLTGDGQDVHLSAGRPEPVEMWMSWAGGVRMRLVDQRQTLRVERLR